MTNLDSKSIRIKHFLKADSYNEEYTILRSDSGSNNNKMINGNEEFFNNILLKYKCQPTGQYYIKQGKTKIYSDKLEKWIKDNIVNPNDDIFIYVEGYAGCGKTTWVQSILHEYSQGYDYLLQNNDISDISKRKHKDDYINFYKSYTRGIEYASDFIRFNIVNSIVISMVYWLKQEKGIKMLDDFCKLLADNEIYTLSNRLPNIANAFHKDFFNKGKREETDFYKYGKMSILNKENRENFIDIFRSNINKRESNDGKFIFSMTDILCIDYIWRLAQYNHDGSNSNMIYVCYDNLDIIDDIDALVDFINDLKNFKTNISEFRKVYTGEIKIAYLRIFATCRRITSSRLQSHGLYIPSTQIVNDVRKTDSNEVAERSERQKNIIEIDISHLYCYEMMLKKRAEFFYKHIEVLVDNDDVNELKTNLDKVLKLPNDVLKELNYSRLWNHNYRACNNILNRIIYDYDKYYEALIEEYHTQHENDYEDTIGANASILLHIIIKILNNNNEWAKSLGYKDKKLTTMSRLILTYLYNKKRQNNESVSLLDLVSTLGNVSLDICEENNDESNTDVNCMYICTLIQNMLTRLPSEDEELWRRPLYYKDHALVCKNEDIYKKLVSQYKKGAGNDISFVISDEGSTFIEKIVPQFEFYSARVNKTSIPLYCISKVNDLKKVLKAVYEKIEQCCTFQITFMERYKRVYAINTTEYLSKDFHPITIVGDKQLHIIRVIFAHIYFINGFRDYLHNNRDKRFLIFNEIIIEYIYKYLKLYDEKFYNIMQDSIGEYNNEVWKGIAIKYNEVATAIKNNLDDHYGTSIRRLITLNDQSKSITKPELLNLNNDK